MTIRARVVFILLVFCLWYDVSAQYRFDSWTTDNGLPQNGIRSITQTPDGYLWLTTLDGLVRFDGVKFKVFNKNNSPGIISNRFWAIKAFADGSVWVATEAGELTIYRDGRFTSYRADQIPGSLVSGFVEDESGEAMIVTELNYLYLRNGEFVSAKSFEVEDLKRVVYVGQSGTRWELFQTEIRQIKDGRTQVYPLKEKFVYFLLGHVFEDAKGGLWASDLGRISYLHNGEITEFTEKDGISASVFGHSFWEDLDGSVWFATGDFNRSGIGLVKFKDGKFSKFGTEYGLSNDRIFNRFKDREGTVWLATDRGLNRLRQQLLTPLSTKNGLVHNEVYPILKARDGSVYIGTNGGLSRYRDGKFTETYSGFSAQSLAEDTENRLWIGTIRGLHVLKDGKVEDWTKEFEQPSTIYTIYPHKDGTVWFGTEHSGVYQYKDGKIAPLYSRSDGLAGNDVKTIHEAKDGSFWIGTFSGLSHLKDGKFISYTTNEGLASDTVRSIKEDEDGTLWIGTYDSGMSRFKDGRFFNFNMENGLFSNGVFAIVEDKNGNFWMSSNQGIYRASKQQLNDFADGKLSSYESFGYGKQDGMLNNECNGGRQPSAMTDSDGRIWFPTLEGIAIVGAEALTKNTLPPPVEIEEISVDRVNIDLKANQTGVEIMPSQTYVDINYTALSLIDSEKLLFRYKLEGFDENWVEAGTKRTVSYTRLPPGSYTFTVTATNSDGVWNPKGKSITIEVLAPFYRTWWFVFAAVLLGIFILFILYRTRVAQLKKQNAAQESFSRQLIESQEAERKRIAQELHDGLGQSLLVIKNRAVLGLNAKGNIKTDEQFNEIQDSVSDALIEVRSIAYNLRPIHIERLGLTSTIEEMIEEIRETSGISVNSDIEPIDDVFATDNQINFYRIVQESMNNFVKHSNADKASIEIFREEQTLVLRIRDNGTGFDIDTVRHGLGLNGMAERAKILGGVYSIESGTGTGTTVLVRISL